MTFEMYPFKRKPNEIRRMRGKSGQWKYYGLTCPNCGKTHSYFRLKTKEWRCRKCGHIWVDRNPLEMKFEEDNICPKSKQKICSTYKDCTRRDKGHYKPCNIKDIVVYWGEKLSTREIEKKLGVPHSHAFNILKKFSKTGIRVIAERRPLAPDESGKFTKDVKEGRVLDYRMLYERDIRKGQLLDPETREVVEEWVITVI